MIRKRAPRTIPSILAAALKVRDAALCRYADTLTRLPSVCAESDVAALRAAGLTDAEVLDTAPITGYFNFVNRLVLGLGVAVESEAEREGCKYDRGSS